MAKHHIDCISDGTDLNKWPTEALRKLNKQIVALIKERSAEEERAAATAFRIGDTVSFYAKKYRSRIHIIVDRINPQTVAGKEVNGTIKWRVSPSLCTLERSNEKKSENPGRATTFN